MEKPRILVLHGPNLNLLGTREPGIYGTSTLEDHVAVVIDSAAKRGIEVTSRQTNSEAELVGFVHGASADAAAIIINAGAFTHYSWALHDALRSFHGPVVEVHLSNPSAREDFRHVSVLAGVVDGTISGFGSLGYELAVEAVVHLIDAR